MQLVGKTFKATLPSGEVSVIQVVDRINISGTYYMRFYKRGVTGLQRSNYYQLKRAIQNNRAVAAASYWQSQEWMSGIFHADAPLTAHQHRERMRQAVPATTIYSPTPTGQWIST